MYYIIRYKNITIFYNNIQYSRLSNRAERVRDNEQLSDKARIESGVPQGTVLGPLDTYKEIYWADQKAT